MGFLSACVTVIFTVSVHSITCSGEHAKPLVDTLNGKLLGTVFESQDSPNPVYAFLGVPYAKPPIGDLRLALAEPVLPWEGTKDATQPGAGCLQHEETMKKAGYPLQIPETALSEDCLYLDVYSPDLNGKNAVMVFLHGGGFIVGKSSTTNGTALAAHENIVVVSINYRIGILGLLQSARNEWPGNLALRDQQFALRWVRDNIATFGGDPERVTLAGQSAGATAVSAHVLSPSSQGLFHRAIMQSGTVFTISTTTDMPDMSQAVIQLLGCDDNEDEEDDDDVEDDDDDNDDDTLACLREKSVEEFLRLPIPLPLAFDDLFFRNPAEVYEAGNFSKVDLLIGVTEHEGFAVAPIFVPELASPEPDPTKVKEQIAQFIAVNHGHSLMEIYQQVVDHYFEGNLTKIEPGLLVEKVADMVGSRMLTAPSHLVAQYHSDYVPNTYFYRVAYAPSFMVPLRPAWHGGRCDHGFDLVFTHGLPLMRDFLPEGMGTNDEDKALAKIAMQYWANFVKSGNPNGDGLVEWKPFTRKDEDHLVLNSECEQASVYRPAEMALWNNNIRGLDQPGLETEDDHDEL